jgi:hypothetical protein
LEALDRKASAQRTEDGELEALPEKKNSKPGEPDGLQVNTSGEGDTPQDLLPDKGAKPSGQKPLPGKRSSGQLSVLALLYNRNEVTTDQKALSHNHTADLFLLRSLIWCGLCHEPFGCCLVSTGIRKYGCMNRGCPRPLVSAEEAEQLVWKSFVLKHEAEAVACKRNQRQAALVGAIARVTIYSSVNDVEVEWRE